MRLKFTSLKEYKGLASFISETLGTSVADRLLLGMKVEGEWVTPSNGGTSALRIRYEGSQVMNIQLFADVQVYAIDPHLLDLYTFLESASVQQAFCQEQTQTRTHYFGIPGMFYGHTTKARNPSMFFSYYEEVPEKTATPGSKKEEPKKTEEPKEEPKKKEDSAPTDQMQFLNANQQKILNHFRDHPNGAWVAFTQNGPVVLRNNAESLNYALLYLSDEKYKIGSRWASCDLNLPDEVLKNLSPGTTTALKHEFDW